MYHRAASRQVTVAMVTPCAYSCLWLDISRTQLLHFLLSSTTASGMSPQASPMQSSVQSAAEGASTKTQPSCNMPQPDIRCAFVFKVRFPLCTQVYDLDTFKVTHASKYPGPVLSLGISPDCGLLAVGQADGQLSIRKHATPKVVPVGAGMSLSMALFKHSSSNTPMRCALKTSTCTCSKYAKWLCA